MEWEWNKSISFSIKKDCFKVKVLNHWAGIKRLGNTSEVWVQLRKRHEHILFPFLLQIRYKNIPDDYFEGKCYNFVVVKGHFSVATTPLLLGRSRSRRQMFSCCSSWEGIWQSTRVHSPGRAPRLIFYSSSANIWLWLASHTLCTTFLELSYIYWSLKIPAVVVWGDCHQNFHWNFLLFVS